MSCSPIKISRSDFNMSKIGNYVLEIPGPHNDAALLTRLLFGKSSNLFVSVVFPNHYYDGLWLRFYCRKRKLSFHF